jgi:hypothetical protein
VRVRLAKEDACGSSVDCASRVGMFGAVRGGVEGMSDAVRGVYSSREVTFMLE